MGCARRRSRRPPGRPADRARSVTQADVARRVAAVDLHRRRNAADGEHPALRRSARPRASRGTPTEPFAPDFRNMWCEQWGLARDVDVGRYVDRALRRGTSNGVDRVQDPMDARRAARAVSSAGREGDVLPSALPSARYVHIVRATGSAQALSWFRAIETSEWWRLDDGQASAAPELDSPRCSELERHIDGQECAWQAYFASREIEPADGRVRRRSPPTTAASSRASWRSSVYPSPLPPPWPRRRGSADRRTLSPSGGESASRGRLIARRSIVVIDDFYDDPEAVRRYALA